MSFYYIKDNYFTVDDTCDVDPNIGIFSEVGIEDAKKKLAVKCKEDIQDDLERKQSILKSHQEEQKVLLDMLKYFNTVDKVTQSKDAVIERLNHLERRIADETKETQRLIGLLNSDDLDEVLKESKYEVVEIPILDSCSEEALKEIY